MNLIPPNVEQCEYSMLERKNIDSKYSDLFKLYRLGTTIFSPLKGGILTVKYLKEILEGARWATIEFMKNRFEKEKNSIRFFLI